MKNNIIQCSLDEVLHNSMIPYAEHVILDRALPRVEDGLKPVQRRILYAMYEMGLTPDKPHKKCAKIVGDCLGKYHPHGDSSVYDALVRMAQPFNMRMPLINGHGNFGTVDGDSAAAYRYTEAKLEPLALELLRDIEKETVKYSLNFDDTILEPDTLPGRYPNLLVNGAMGIAVGLATNIPTHNLKEVIDGTIAYIDNNKITLKEMMTYIKGPDFPTGGYIIAGEELYNAYNTGRSKIKIRAKISIEKDNGKENLIISEIPFQVNKANLLKKIAELKEEKKDIFSGISEIVDESDRNGMRAVIKLKKDTNSNQVIQNLYKYSDLECTFGINMVAIANGKPKQMSLLEIISYYVDYQQQVIIRRSKYDLEKAKERAHILEGLIIAVKNIDEVIKIIRNADNVNDARKKLCIRFSLSEAQANAVLDLRLARLTKLEITKLKEELKQLKEQINNLIAIIGSKKLQMEVIKNELLEIRNKYKDERRTKIVGDEKFVKIESHKDNKVASPYVVGISLNNNFKKMPLKNYNMSDKSVNEKTNDNDIFKIIINANSIDNLLGFTNKGNAYKIDLEVVPECKYKDKGLKLNSVFKGISENEYIVSIINYKQNDNTDLLFFTKEGMIKKTSFNEYIVSKNMFQAIKLKENDELLSVETDRKDSTIIFVTENGMSLNAVKDDVPVQGRISGGVKGINLNEGDKIVFISQIEDSGEIIVITSNGLYKRVIASEIEPSPRYRKGVKICTLEDNVKIIFSSFVQNPYNIIIKQEDNNFMVNSEDILIESRTNKGKKLTGEYKNCIPVKIIKA